MHNMLLAAPWSQRGLGPRSGQRARARSRTGEGRATRAVQGGRVGRVQGLEARRPPARWAMEGEPAQGWGDEEEEGEGQFQEGPVVVADLKRYWKAYRSRGRQFELARCKRFSNLRPKY